MNGLTPATRLSLLAGLGFLLAAPGSARATSCLNDVDCPNSACGGEVCDYYSDPTLTCKPAGTQAKGIDGWCSSDSDCKCAALGATCTSSGSCSFTKPTDAPSGGGGNAGADAGAAGSSGAAGSAGPGSGGNSAGSGAGGSGTGGSGTGGTGAGGSATAGQTGSTGGGGCSLGGSPGPAWGLALSVFAGLAVAVRQRRRHR